MAEAKGTTNAQTTSYEYDAVGNRTKKTVPNETETYIYPAVKNRLAKMTKVTTHADDSTTTVISKPCYIGTGAIAGMTPTTCDLTAYTQHYSYNVFARMSGTDVSVDGPADYTINALGQRVIKDVASTTYFQYSSDGKLLAEHPLDVPALTNVVEYIYADNLPIAYVVKSGTSYQIYSIVTDHLGTPQLITDQSQAVVWKADYDAFGKAVINPELMTFNLRFPGQYFDKETGLHYNYYRDYDPALGRYVQSDPIGLKGGINTYAYVANNPVMFFDLLGLLPGEPYPSADTAAVQAIKDINGQSISECREYAGTIYKTSYGMYSYTPPNPGGKYWSWTGVVPEGSTKAGDYHTHGDTDPFKDNENFSWNDMYWDQMQMLPGYLGTPGGDIKKHDPVFGNY